MNRTELRDQLSVWLYGDESTLPLLEYAERFRSEISKEMVKGMYIEFETDSGFRPMESLLNYEWDLKDLLKDHDNGYFDLGDNVSMVEGMVDILRFISSAIFENEVYKDEQLDVLPEAVEFLGEFLKEPENFDLGEWGDVKRRLMDHGWAVNIYMLDAYVEGTDCDELEDDVRDAVDELENSNINVSDGSEAREELMRAKARFDGHIERIAKGYGGCEFVWSRRGYPAVDVGNLTIELVIDCMEGEFTEDYKEQFDEFGYEKALLKGEGIQVYHI